MITLWKCCCHKARDGKTQNLIFKKVDNIFVWWYHSFVQNHSIYLRGCFKGKMQILHSHICFGICCFQMLFLAVDRVLWKQTYFLTFFLLGELCIIRVPVRGGLSIWYQEMHSNLLWPVVWEMCSHVAFPISLSCWLLPKPDLGRAGSSGNVLFLVVLVFAKFSIKRVQQAKKPASLLCSPPLFLIFIMFLLFAIVCTYIASLYVYTYKYLRIFSM